jgi:hypothetical protein
VVRHLCERGVVLAGVEIVNFIDDHSRAMLCSSVVAVARAADVVRLFYQCVEAYGLPQSVLSDNGAIYTTAYRGGHSGLEIELAMLGVRFKHGKPYHPQTQGKVERYHLTLKKWLRRQPGASSIEELQSQVDRFVRYYNEERPHQARGVPPMHAWRTFDKATPEVDGQPILAKTKVRRDHVDHWGSVTLRYRSNAGCFKSRAIPRHYMKTVGAGDGNRTRVLNLKGWGLL